MRSPCITAARSSSSALTSRTTGPATTRGPWSEGSGDCSEETPVVLDSSGTASVGPMPDLTGAQFDLATTNGVAAGLNATEEIQLVDFNNSVISTPSAPDSDTDGFMSWTY